MARLWQTGFELNSLTAGVEFSIIDGPPTIATAPNPVRSGTYSLKCLASGAAAHVKHQFISSNQNGPYWARVYIYIDVAFAGTDDVLTFQQTGGANIAGIVLNSDNTLTLKTNSTTIGTSTFALNLKQWYRLELFADNTGGANAFKVSGLVDGITFSSTTTNNNGFGFGMLVIGPTGGFKASGTAYFDDAAVNDSTGSFQNSFPGAGQVVHLRPNAAGDSAGWTPTSGANYTNVNEVTPNDATNLVADSVLNDADMYNCDNSALPIGATVNVVAVGVRFRNDIADATTQFKVQIEKTASGTISQSAAITANSTTWKTNTTALPWNYPLVTYQDPDSANWTPATLDTLQIGVKSTLIGVNKNQVSTIWASVDYVAPIGKVFMINQSVNRSNTY